MVEEVGGTPARTRGQARLKKIRADYEGRALTLNAISRRYEMSLPQLLEHARAQQWQRPDSDLADRRILINQLLGLLERQIEQLDMTVATTGDKDVAVLNKLAASLEKLIAMNKAEASGKDADDAESDEVRDIRIKLAKRIDALTKG